MAQKRKLTIRKSALERLLMWIIVGVFLVLPLLYFPHRAASYITSKQYFLIGTIDIMAILWTWLLLVDKRYRLTRKNLLLLTPLFLFLVSLTISGFSGVDPATSFFSTVESGTGLILLYHVFIFICILASCIRVQGKTLLKYILQATVFASAILAIFTFFTGGNGLIQTNSAMLNGSSGGAMMGNSLLAGAYFVFSIFLAIYLIVHESNIWKKVSYWLALLLVLFSPIFFNVGILKGVPFATLVSSHYFFIGEARIAFVAIVAGLLLSLFLWFRLQKENKALRIVGSLGLVIGILFSIVVVREISIPTTPLHQFFVTAGGNRTVDWQEAIEGIKARPLLGWGPENFHVIYQQYLNPIVYSPGHGNEAWALHPHNNTFEVLTNGGIIGFICYLLVLVALFGGLFKLYKKGHIDSKTYALLMGMLIAYIIQQQMIYDSITTYTMFFSVIAIIAGLSDQNTVPYASDSFSSTTVYSFSIIVLLVFLPIWFYAAYLPAQKMDEFQRVADASSYDRIALYKHLFHSPGSYAINTDVEFYTDPLFYSYDPQRVVLRTNSEYQKVASGEIQSLLVAVDPVWQTRYRDYHLTLSLIDLDNLQFYLTNDPQYLAKADIYATRAFALSPTDPQIYFSYAQTLVYENKKSQAIILLKKAIALNANYDGAQDFLNNLQK